MKIHIPEIELNTCNVCGARCYLCSAARGRGNVPLMTPDVFARVIEQLHTITFDVIQTSGNGDCFLNPHFMGYLRTLRREFPAATICNYSSFGMYSPAIADAVIGERLIDKQFTRIDSLDETTAARASGLNPRLVRGNLEHFVRHNRAIELNIGYSSIQQYYRKCQQLLGHPPFHGPFTPVEADAMPDEFGVIQNHFGALNRDNPPTVARINQSLWGEREHPLTKPDPTGVCPKLGLLERIVWICPDGTVDLCGYDDTQRAFETGNIMSQQLIDIWTGPKRRKLLEDIRARRWTDYPCNPTCCKMYRDDK